MPLHPPPHNRLWITRTKRALGRKKLAALLGHTTTSQLARWEAGTQLPSLANALLLGYLLETPVEFLFKGLRDEMIRQVQQRQPTDELDGDGADAACEH